MFLAGVQLLTVDEKVPGPARERLLVSYYRYSGQAGHNSHVDTVCELLRQEILDDEREEISEYLVRSTGYIPGNKRPQNYPETLINRIPVEKSVVNKLVGRLRSDDLYNLLPHYPETQAGLEHLA